MADLENYLFPLAKRLHSHSLVSVWAAKRHAADSWISATPTRKTLPPTILRSVRTTASVGSVKNKEQVRESLAGVAELPTGPVRLEIAFTVGPVRNWLNLWKPTIDALDPLLGRSSPDRLWHPKDGRIIELGLHVTIDDQLSNNVQIFIAAEPAAEHDAAAQQHRAEKSRAMTSSFQRIMYAQIEWAHTYDAYARLAGSPQALATLLEPAWREYHQTGRVPDWCGVDLLRGWAFYITRADHHGGGYGLEEGGSMVPEWTAVLERIASHEATKAR